jgi:cytochrome b involved in lipid metabolism
MQKNFQSGLILILIISLSGCLGEQKITLDEQYLLTFEEVSQHNSPEDCWLIINGKVYDITSYKDHPGGTEMLYQWCGKESSETFSTKENQGRDHEEWAYDLLGEYYIGDIVNE